MGTFYRGNSLLNNKVVENYLDGKYFNNSTKAMETIPVGINKYNLAFLDQLTESSKDFYTLIITEKIAIKLMQLNSNKNEAEIRNLWNLIKSQGGTIRYNRVFRKALKKYGITKKVLYNEIEKEINKQKDRVIRNRALIISLLKEYGLGSLLEIVEKENGMNICEHIKDFTLKHDLDIAAGVNRDDSDELKEYYENIENTYIDYLKDTASKYGINLDNAIADDLLKHREIVDKRIQDIKQSKADKKELDKRLMAFEAMDKDNSGLFNDLNRDWYDKFTRINETMAMQMRERLSVLGGEGWYVAICKQSTVYYIRADYKTTKDIRKTPLFETAEDAEKFYEIAKSKEYEVRISYHKVYRLENPDKKSYVQVPGSEKQTTKTEQQLIYESNKKMSEINDTLGKLLSTDAKELTIYDQRTIKDILMSQHGLDCSRSDGQFMLFKATDTDGRVKLIGVEETNGVRTGLKFVSHYMNALKAYPGENIQEYLGLIDIFLKHKTRKSGVVTEVINFDSKWYKSALDTLNKEYTTVIDMLYNPDKHYGHKNSGNVQRFSDRLVELKNNGASKAWIIAYLCTGNGKMQYLTKNNGQNINVGLSKIYTTYEDALTDLKNYPAKTCSTVPKIFCIDLM